MFALLFIGLYGSTQYAQSLPITPQFIYTRSSNHHCEDPNQCRTVWNIIQSCLTTVLACTWVALHMNIPGPDDSRLSRTTRRIGIMALALVAPELVVVLAMRQWFAAGRYAEQYKEYGWTRTHGFFAIMGGFMLYDGDRPVRMLKPEELGPYLQSHEIEITGEEIKDRSKGDILSKAVVLVQTSWFILQCIARQIERLPITELEIATLAFAALNFATYLLWLDKPLSVKCAVPLRRRLSFAKDENVQDEVPSSRGVVEAIKSGVRHSPDAIRGLVRYFGERGFWGTVFDGIFRLIRGNGDVETRASTFYTGDAREAELSVALMGLGCAMIFGAIHCIAWSFHFPTPTEQLLWRISSVAITSEPMVVHMLHVAAHRSNILFLKTFFTILFSTASFLYIFSRLVLLVIPFTSLRSLPSEAYQTVRWTTFIPHL